METWSHSESFVKLAMGPANAASSLEQQAVATVTAPAPPARAASPPGSPAPPARASPSGAPRRGGAAKPHLPTCGTWWRLCFQVPPRVLYADGPVNSALTGPRAPPEPQSGSGAHAADVHDGTPRAGEALLKA
jgi:hypothetical protein